MPEIVADNISIIRSDELEGTTRIDAEYYQKEYIILKDKLVAIGSIPLLTLISSNVITGHTPSMKNDKFYGGAINFIKTDNLRENQITENFNHTLTEIGNKQILKSSLKEKDIIVTIIGATFDIIGRACLVSKEILPANINQNIALIRVNRKILPECLTIYLNTQFGRKYLHYLSRQTEQVNLSCREIEQLLVPLLPMDFQYQIKTLLEKSHGLFEQSKVLYSQAENLLLKELGIKDIDLSHEPCYEVNSVDAINSNRIDAEYFQPKYERMIEAVRNKCGMLNIEDIFDFRRGDFIDVKYYTEEKTARPFIRIKELSINSTINSDEVIYINDEYANNKTTTLRTGDLVIAIIGDTIGKTNLILEEFEGGFCSNNTGVLRLKEFYKNRFDLFFLEKIFHSIFIQLQIEKRKAQTGQPKIADKEIKQIGIPLVDYQKQRAIGDLICQSHSARRQAKELLDEAKRKVEEMIEKE